MLHAEILPQIIRKLKKEWGKYPMFRVLSSCGPHHKPELCFFRYSRGDRPEYRLNEREKSIILANLQL